MATIDQFAISQGWSITGWGVTGTVFPQNGFTTGGTLVIGVVQDQLTPACGLVWLNLDGQPCSIANLPYKSDGGILSGIPFPVSFAGWQATCDVILSIDSGGTLHGSFDDGGSGNTGAFTADANVG